MPGAERQPSRFERISEGLFNKTLAAYDKGLRWVLEHQLLTLVVFVLTLVLTAVLYIVIQKNMFPVQDVGVIEGISVADNSVSYKAMVTRQSALADQILKDPDVVSLTSYVGIDGATPRSTMAASRSICATTTSVRTPRRRSRGACRTKSRMCPGSSSICSRSRT